MSLSFTAQSSTHRPTQPISSKTQEAASPTWNQQDFYPKVVREVIELCGHECESPNYHKAVSALDVKLDLGLSPDLEKVFGLLFGHLSFAERFRGNAFIPPLKGENSAVHSLHSAILTTECFRRAGLLSSSLSPEVATEVMALRRRAAVGALIHDMGELLGEINSLSSATLGGVTKDDTPFEQRVFVASLKLAFHAVEYGKVPEFALLMRECQEEAGVSSSSGKVSKKILGSVEKLEQAASIIDDFLTPSARKQISGLVALYETVEVPKDAETSREKFLGYFVKACEHTQGSRHFVRFSRKLETSQVPKWFSPHSTSYPRSSEVGQQLLFSDDLALPFELAHSQEIVSGCKYTEGEVGHIFYHAASDVEKKLALVARDMVYLSSAERFHLYGARFVDRTHFQMKKSETDGSWIKANQEPLEPEEARLLSVMQVITKNQGAMGERNGNYHRAQELLVEHMVRLREKASLQPLGWEQRDELQPIEHCMRLRDLCLYAVEVNFQPAPGELLFNLNQLPPILQGYSAPRSLAERTEAICSAPILPPVEAADIGIAVLPSLFDDPEMRSSPGDLIDDDGVPGGGLPTGMRYGRERLHREITRAAERERDRKSGS